MNNAQRVWLLALVVCPIIFFLIPREMLFNGRSICLSKLLFDSECPGCGITRALYLAMHCCPSEAMSYNWRVVVVAPLITGLYIRELWRLLR